MIGLAKKGLPLLVAMAMGGLASAAPKFWDTGEGLSGGMADLHWTAQKVAGSTLHFGTTPTYVMSETSYPVAGAYRHAGFSTSKWVSFSLDGLCNSDDIFRIEQRVYIDPALLAGNGGTVPIGSEPGGGGSIVFRGAFSSDNASEMYVNGTAVASLAYYSASEGYSWQARREFDAGEHLQGGWNTVTFLVGAGDTMGGNAGPNVEWLGLRVEGEIEVHAVPEPATLAALALGLAAFRRRRRS